MALLLPVRVLGKLFGRLFLTRLMALDDAGRLACLRHLALSRKKRRVIDAKPPFAGPQAVLAYLSRYTHRVAISNSRLLHFDEDDVTFRYKNYRINGAERQQATTLSPDELIRLFLLHVLPKGFHRIRHYGVLAGATYKANLERARELFGIDPPVTAAKPVVHLPAPDFFHTCGHSGRPSHSPTLTIYSSLHHVFWNTASQP